MAALSSADTNAATEHVGKVPIIEVAFRNGMWWAIPQDMSQKLYDRYQAREVEIGYTWDWGTGRAVLQRAPQTSQRFCANRSAPGDSSLKPTRQLVGR